MDEKGQITIEAILIFAIFVLFFVGITFPGMLTVSKNSDDISAALEGKKNLNAIAAGIDMVRKGGPGTVKTVPITSNIKNWSLNAYAQNHTLVYLIDWNSASNVPDQMPIKVGSQGGIGVKSFDGIASTGTTSGYSFSSGDGQGRWYVKITNNATSTTPSISISNTLVNSDTIEVIIQ
jgi:uncharacterized protein (UPF0333 family)